MLNQPKALIYVPVDIVETSMVAVRQMPKHLGDAVSWQNSELSARHTDIFSFAGHRSI
jgi:hypothetical protein